MRETAKGIGEWQVEQSERLHQMELPGMPIAQNSLSIDENLEAVGMSLIGAAVTVRSLGQQLLTLQSGDMRSSLDIQERREHIQSELLVLRELSLIISAQQKILIYILRVWPSILSSGESVTAINALKDMLEDLWTSVS